jgi:hypothetical protein
MSRAFLLLAAAAAGCSAKIVDANVCNQNPPPAACGMTCDPNGPDTCPSGFHCSASGTCDGNSSNGPDAACPAVHFVPMKTTPSIELLIDRSGSMDTNFGGVSRFQAIKNGLFGNTGAVAKNQASVYFGEAMFAGDQQPCLTLSGFTAPRAMNNASALSTLTNNNPPNNGSTPTADALDQIVADFAAHPPPAGSPPIILLATDGLPNSCNNGGGNGPSIASTKAAYAAGIRTFILGLAGVADQYLQDIANAGTGVATGQAPGCTGCSPYYTANDPAALSAGFASIINGVISCDLNITGKIDTTQASTGVVTLDGVMLVYGTDWTLDPNGTTIHIVGNACTKLKTDASPVVDASFPCGSVIQ